MNTFINSPVVAETFTRQLIDERIWEAQRRRTAREARRARRAAAREARAAASTGATRPQSTAPWVPGMSFRSTSTAH